MTEKIYTIPLMAIVVLGILLAGCTQPSGTSSVPSASTTETVTAATTTVPQPVVTLIHYVSQVKDIKDSELLFALQVPVEWNVTTHRLENSDTTKGLTYQTDLTGDEVFSIRTYAISHSQDQAYRDEFRMWYPAPAETTVKINDITYDRFESTSDSKTRVAYVARKNSANERGYASVLSFTANTSNRFEKVNFEKVVSSFRYFGGKSASTEPGEEIPLYDSAGNVVSRKESGGRFLAWGEWEGDSLGRDSSSGGSSGGGCGCDS